MQTKALRFKMSLNVDINAMLVLNWQHVQIYNAVIQAQDMCSCCGNLI